MSSSAESASATRINLVPATDAGVFSAGVREDTARVASSLLQDDMEKHHVFFNDQGFHSMSFNLLDFPGCYSKYSLWLLIEM
jgi:hypothetical protein